MRRSRNLNDLKIDYFLQWLRIPFTWNNLNEWQFICISLYSLIPLEFLKTLKINNPNKHKIHGFDYFWLVHATFSFKQFYLFTGLNSIDLFLTVLESWQTKVKFCPINFLFFLLSVLMCKEALLDVAIHCLMYSWQYSPVSPSDFSSPLYNNFS
jgi:hypothetical protein